MFKKLALAGALCCALGSVAQAQLATIFAEPQTATLSAAPLPSLTIANGVVITADASNTGTICVGGPSVTMTTHCYPLKPGQSISYGAGNLSSIYMIGANTTDKLYFTGY